MQELLLIKRRRRGDVVEFYIVSNSIVTAMHQPVPVLVVVVFFYLISNYDAWLAHHLSNTVDKRGKQHPQYFPPSFPRRKVRGKVCKTFLFPPNSNNFHSNFPPNFPPRRKVWRKVLGVESQHDSAKIYCLAATLVCSNSFS